MQGKLSKRLSFSEHRHGAFAMMKPFSSFGLRPQLGPFERLVRRVWTHGRATVRQPLWYGEFRRTYATVMTTVDCLSENGLLDRRAEGRAFRCVQHHSRAELRRVAPPDSTRQLGSGHRCPHPVSYRVEGPGTRDGQLLDEFQLRFEHELWKPMDQEKTGEQR